MELQLKLNDGELKFIQQLIDLSLKTYGSNALGAAFQLSMKIETAIQSQSMAAARIPGSAGLHSPPAPAEAPPVPKTDG